jgi:hypothetical protein
MNAPDAAASSAASLSLRRLALLLLLGLASAGAGSARREEQLQLLLAQNEALVYLTHLVDTLSRSESDAARLAFVRTLWKELARLQGDVAALLRRSG